jgi:poly-gamma-glutamate synthesis protein (capsule biosynthesis protein)
MHVGTARSKAGADEFLIVERNGVKLAFLSYTYSLNGSGFPETAHVNHAHLNTPGADLEPLYRQIARAKTEGGADVVIACLHWGLEFESYPTRHFVDTTRALWEHGADVLVGNHAHGVQPVEPHVCADPFSAVEKPRLAFFALGDLLSWHPSRNTRLGLLAKFTVQKGDVNGESVAFVSGAELVPTYLYSALKREICSDFRVLRLWGDADVPLTRRDKREMKRLRALQKKVVPDA